MKSTDVAPEGAWYKSSYSGAEGNACVEIAKLTDEVAIRDSKDTAGPALVVTRASWTAFVGLIGSSDAAHSPAN
ncbi:MULTISPECIES: DUF397 domain-containing protein [Streptomyces]|uniref:DUF397 domain-containing protein n=1 Tax=Streptomyces TaxID=1883 RepID=UPI001559922B|nr:DUF397 domain-containing protein [Streptomyces kasugaensis]